MIQTNVASLSDCVRACKIKHFTEGKFSRIFSLAGVILRFQKGNSRWPCLPRISGNWNDNYRDLITSRLYVTFPEISENFEIISGILHFRKFRNPSAYMIPQDVNTVGGTVSKIYRSE